MHNKRLDISLHKRYTDIKKANLVAHLRSGREEGYKIPKCRYYKEYKKLTFDVVHSKQQVTRFNRLSKMVLKQESDTLGVYKPTILAPSFTSSRHNTIIKRINHIPEKFSAIH